MPRCHPDDFRTIDVKTEADAHVRSSKWVPLVVTSSRVASCEAWETGPRYEYKNVNNINFEDGVKKEEPDDGYEDRVGTSTRFRKDQSPTTGEREVKMEPEDEIKQ